MAIMSIANGRISAARPDRPRRGSAAPSRGSRRRAPRPAPRMSGSRSACGSMSKKAWKLSASAAMRVSPSMSARTRASPAGTVGRLLDEAAVGVVHQRVDQGGDEAGLVAEVVADAGLGLAGLASDGRQLERLEPALRQQPLRRRQDPLRRRRQRLHGVLQQQRLRQPLPASQAPASLVDRCHESLIGSSLRGNGRLPCSACQCSVHLSVRTNKLSATPLPASRDHDRRKSWTPRSPPSRSTAAVTS